MLKAFSERAATFALELKYKPAIYLINKERDLQMKFDKQFWKAVLNRILFPPLFIILLLTAFSAAALVVVFVNGLSETAIAYAVYPISAYSLTVFSIACAKTIPEKYMQIKEKAYKNKYIYRYLTDRVFKLRVDLYRSLTFNIMYVAFNVVSSFIYDTAWFSIFAGYYGIMAIMRFLLVRYAKNNEIEIGKVRIGEYKRSRVCAFLLIAITSSLSSAVVMMILFDRGFEYKGLLIYVMAAYTFYITTMSIIDFIRCRKYNSPIIATSAAIRLAAALGSMLFLETAMFAQFGAPGSREIQHAIIMLTGDGISAIVIAMAVVMIIRSTKAIRRIRKEENNKKEAKEHINGK